jgi:peptidoglycan/LPS O-acetylase OafA/YrhL
MQQTINRENNFDLIRLVAAMQVMLWHGADHLGLFQTLWDYLTVLYHIPGVPIFFTISGFLISHSVMSAKGNWWKYTKNRILRIYPALLNCLFITIIVLFAFGQITLESIRSKEIIGWIVAQATFFQFYTAGSLKHWATGSPNGSLWSVAVELQFYLFLPIFLIGFMTKIKNRLFQNLILLGLMILAFMFSYGVEHQWFTEKNSITEKLLGASVFNYLRFFLIGIGLYLNFDIIRPFLEKKAYIWLLIYCIFAYFIGHKMKLYENVYDLNFYGQIGSILLSVATISLAFTMPKLSKSLIGNNDISYGTYIYHMLVFNTAFAIYPTPSVAEYLFLNVLTLFIAWLSWKLIEKPALALK